MSDTLFLRALAAVLIANSHLELFYPARALATDGMLGDSLFFMLSGYGLVLSESRTRRNFAEWYRRRLGRIWPSVFVAVLVFDFCIRGGWRSWGATEYVANFGWANGCYSFIREILIMYVFAFPIVRSRNRNVFLAVALALLPLYALGPVVAGNATYANLHLLFYFQMMLFGGWLAHGSATIRPGGRGVFLGLLGVLAIYFGSRFCVAGGLISRWTFLPQILIVPLTYLLLRFARSEAVTRLMTARFAGPIIAGLGAMSLEVYLAQRQFFPSRTLAALPFPINVIVFYILTFTVAKALAWASAKLVNISTQSRPLKSARISESAI